MWEKKEKKRGIDCISTHTHAHANTPANTPSPNIVVQRHALLHCSNITQNVQQQHWETVTDVRRKLSGWRKNPKTSTTSILWPRDGSPKSEYTPLIRSASSGYTAIALCQWVLFEKGKKEKEKKKRDACKRAAARGGGYSFHGDG